jgi:hypothetical protein
MATTQRLAELVRRNRAGVASFYNYFTTDAEADRLHRETLLAVVDHFAATADEGEAAAMTEFLAYWSARPEEPIQFILDAYIDGKELRRNRAPRVAALATYIDSNRAVIAAARDNFMMR